MALVLISVFGGLLWHFLLGFALSQWAWCQAVSCEPRSAVIVVIFMCVLLHVGRVLLCLAFGVS